MSYSPRVDRLTVWKKFTQGKELLRNKEKVLPAYIRNTYKESASGLKEEKVGKNTFKERFHVLQTHWRNP